MAGGEVWTSDGQTNGIIFSNSSVPDHDCSMVADGGGGGGEAWTLAAAGREASMIGIGTYEYEP